MIHTWVPLFSGRRCKAAGAVFLGLLLPFLLWTGAGAGEAVRVAVGEGQASVRISSNTSLLIKDAGGRLLYPGELTSADIRPVERGLSVNGLLFREPLIKVLSLKSDLEVDGRPFRGLIEVQRQGNGLLLINELDIEDYLKGVVPEEMAYDWPLEALKVQAIVARTYALYQKYRNQGKKYHLVSTILDQVYRGVARERPESSMAVALTDGLVVTHEGALAMTLYHSTSAGRTENVRELWERDLIYLRGVECPFDAESPYYRWERKVRLEDFESSLRSNGMPMGFLATLSPNRWTSTGRVKEVRILHSKGELFLKGADARKIIGYQTLPSTQFEVVEIGRDIIFRGKGYGHGVGLCQWGAKVQAERGKLYKDIIEYYYPGVQIMDYRTLALGAQTEP